MSVLIAKQELDSITDFQKEIHYVNDLQESIIFNFYRVFTKSSWYSCVPMKLASSKDGEYTVYTVNNTFHLLTYSYLSSSLPAVRVKSEYTKRVRIAWCHNPVTNQIITASFKEDDDDYHTIDNVWCDIYFQYFQEPGAGKRHNHNEGMGNVPCLEQWSEFLPSYPYNVEQPWFYSLDPGDAFPIFYKNSQTRAQHRYQYKRNILDLLRVQYLNRNQEWVDCVEEQSQFLDITEKSELNLPELWGRYVYLTENEIKHMKCFQNRDFYIRDVKICDAPNPNKYKTTAEVDLTCSNPCLAMFWVAENKNAINKNNYSNYTTNADNLYHGWDPIKTTTLRYGTTDRLNNMSSDHFSIAEPRKHFKSAPNEKGYHAYSFAWDSMCTDATIGIVFDDLKAKLLCSIFNNNIFLNLPSNKLDQKKLTNDIINFDEKHKETKVVAKSPEIVSEDSDLEFILRARLLVLRKFSIRENPNADEKAVSPYTFTVK